MELKFQTPRNMDFSALKGKSSRIKSCKKNKFLGVRQRPSGKWVAEIKNTTQKIRMWLGTYDTAEEAARAYDEAAFLLRGSNTRKNFVDHCPSDSPISLKVKSLLNQKRASKQIRTLKPINSSSEAITRTTSQKTRHVSPKSISQDFNIAYEELPNYNFSFEAATPMNQTCTDTSSQIYSPFSYSGNSSPETSGCSNQDFQSFHDDVYKPDLSQFFVGEENGTNSFQFGQVLDDELYQILSEKEEFVIEKRNQLALEMSENGFLDFEHMKVERQISASLYALNGVNEYWESFNNHNDCLWDFPMV